ncbi:MAG: DNA-binding protein [Phycisphaerae bacterium]
MASNVSSPPTTAPLALRPVEAAKAIGIGQRKLWDLLSPRGPIPTVRVGTCVLIPVDGLRTWLAANTAKETA